MSFADIAAACHLSLLDYLDEIAWDQHPPCASGMCA